MKIALGTWPFGVFAEASPIEFDAVLDRAAKLGFDGIEFAAMAPHPDPVSMAGFEDRKELMVRIASRGLKVPSVVRFSDGTIISEAKPTKYLEDFDDTLKFCADLGVTRMWVCTGDAPEVISEIGYKTAFDRLMRTWGECARKADAVGVTLVWEFEIGSAFNESSQVVEVAHALSGPGFGVLYDTAHAHMICEQDTKGANSGTPGDGQIELLRQLNGTIAHVHLGDSGGELTAFSATAAGYVGTDRVTATHVPLGHGEVPFDRVLPALRQTALGAEWWTVDLCFCAGAWSAIEESKAFVDRHLALPSS